MPRRFAKFWMKVIILKHMLEDYNYMMGGRSWDDWIEEYSESHQDPINKLTHAIGIPMIAVSILIAPTSFFVPGFWTIPVALFLVGWILQFIGHYFEGKPPEFFKDWRFLLVGLRWWFKKILGVNFGSKTAK